MSRKQWWMVAAAAVLIVISASGWYYFQSAKKLMLSEADQRALIIPVAHLEEYGVSATCGAPCTHYAHHYRSGGLEVTYEYKSALDAAATEELYVASGAMIALSTLSAWENYWTYLASFYVGFSASRNEVTLERVKNDALKLGEQHYWARLRNKQGPVGDFVVVRQGRAVLTYVISGVYFTEPADLEALLRPALEKAAALEAAR